MRRLTVAATLIVIPLLLFPVIISDDSEALDDGMVIYCYGDNPILTYEYEQLDTIEVHWSAVDEFDGAVDCSTERGFSTTVHLAEVGYGSEVTVTQTVFSNGIVMDSMTIVLIPLHIGGESYDVTFMDGANSLGTQTITNRSWIIQGNDHVIMPANPVKEGYTFSGWFLDSSFTQEFDPKSPITDDVIVYAKWVGFGVDGGSSTVIVGDNYTVTFQTVTGLEYDILSQTSTSVSFRVSVVGGYELIGAVDVTSTGGTITQVEDGEFLLSGIDSNIVVNIMGNTVPVDDDITDDNPEGPSINNGNDYTLYAILLIILAVICIALAVYIMRTRGSRV